MPSPVHWFWHVFRGRRYKVVRTHAMREELNGWCDAPDTPNKEIRIRPNLRGKEMLTTAIDEGIHACLWELDNDVVGEVADSLADFLWKLGYRQVETKKK